MTRLSRRSPRSLTVSVCGLLVACLALVPSFSTSTRASDPSCADLKRWAGAYQDGPVTIADLAPLDRVHRKALFNAVSPAVRASLVREHLGQVADHSDLSPQQLAFIKEAIELATPEFYTGRDSRLMVQFEAFWQRAELAFPSDLRRRVWFSLGPAPPVSQPANSLLGRLSGVATVYAQDDRPCECHPNSAQYECGGGWCRNGGCLEYWGCGPNGVYMCIGTCAE